MDSQIQSGTRQRRAQRGVSLIEVLVVLVILVVGILTIIRLFPSGFFSIQSTGNVALANSLGSAAIDLGAQNAQSLPDAILPDAQAPNPDDLAAAVMNSAAYSNYDPDDPNNLENARVVTNETVSVPSVSHQQSIYVVKYGPVVMPANPATNAAQLPLYFTINSPNWTALPGNFNPAPVAGSTAPADTPQEDLVPGQERFLVDLANKKIAVPYAAYTPDGTTSSNAGGPMVQDANSYAQKMVLTITCTDGSVYPIYLDVPAGTPKDKNSPYAPFGPDNKTYLADVPGTTGMPGTGDYHGGWFDPTAEYLDSPSGTPPPNTKIWASVTLYRPYDGLALNQANGGAMTPITFSNDPYEFQMPAANIGSSANPGVVSFNPKAAVGSGAQARKAQISYIVYSWGILREDHDIPALTGTGSTFAVRTTVPNLLSAGSANPDNSINPGIAGSSDSIVILDLDSGQIIAPGTDPTLLNDEDLNGTVPNSPATINVSYSLGRLTFGSDAFGDNSSATPADGTGTAPAHRIRIFYTADLDWTVAVQKPAAYFQALGNPPVQNATGTTALAANQYAYDSADAFVYFARCNASKTVEIDGSYTAGGTTQGFSDTVAVDPTLYAIGDSAVRVDLTDGTKFAHPVPAGAAVTFSAVRGLSARSVVAWKERNLYKVHTVDAVLNRTP